MEEFSTYLANTPSEVRSQSVQQRLTQPSMQDQMAAHHQQQQTMLQQSQPPMNPAWRPGPQVQPHQQHQHQQPAQPVQQLQQLQQQAPMGPFAYPPPTAQSTPSSAAPQPHSLTPRSFAEAMGIDPNAFTTEIAFQLPSFLTGPTVAPGGGGDVVPGSASNMQQPDSYSNTWYAGGTQNSHASGSGLNVRSPNDYPGFSPYAMQNSQDDQYAPNPSERAGLMQPPDMMQYPPQEDSYGFGGDMGMPQSQSVHPQALQASNPNYTSPAAPVSNFQAPRQSSLPASAPAPAPVIGPLPAVSGTVMPGLYSTSGFDMLGVLARVASRPNPKIVLGPVDLTCSFTVVDVKRYDQPIVYSSPTFHRLTGYDQSEIIGRNCRFLQVGHLSGAADWGTDKLVFLQAPNGRVERGSTRTYTDNAAVAHFKKSLAADKECQASLINYRKNGAPFINLVSIIPIKWDSDEIRYHVGFQVDLVDQPHAILQTMRDGSYIVNYSLQSNPQPTLSPGRDKIGMLSPELRRVIANTMSASGFGSGDEQERQDLNMMLLEHSDDFIHVLSLKGSFLYVSPSVRYILEYEPEELIGKSISDVTHPSDIVPVMRELKESSSIVPSSNHGGGSVQKTVNLLLRVRRKTSGYVWVESQGRLHVEPGKGRKAIILSGRKKEVPRLQWSSIARAGGLGDREFWVQMSVDGLVLVASVGVHEIMGYTPDEFLGTNLIVDHILEEWKPSILARLASAISPTRAIAIASELVRRPDAGLDATMPEIARCVLITKHGQKISSDVCFYPPLASLDDGAPGSVPAIKPAPASLVCQVKVVSADMMGRPRSQTTGSLDSSIAGPSSGIFGGRMTGEPLSSGVTGQLQGHIVHHLSSNLFEELETTRSTSWQYELQQLKISNKRMKDEVDSIVERMSSVETGVDKTRKRRTRDNPEGDQP
ncbi:blue light receptor [Ceratobasidium sp. 414]|nr:blue light receptor [Ceratobasidium sp. 414]